MMARKRSFTICAPARTRSQSPRSKASSESYKGGTLRIVAGIAKRPPHFIIAQPEIKTLADLKGKTIGVVSMHEGTTFFVADIAKAGGFALNDVKVEAVGGSPTRARLLKERKIDMGLQPYPLSYERKRKALPISVRWQSSFPTTNSFRSWSTRIGQARTGGLSSLFSKRCGAAPTTCLRIPKNRRSSPPRSCEPAPRLRGVRSRTRSAWTSCHAIFP